MSSKVYAVKVGFDKFKGEKVENKIYDNWVDCQKVVTKVKAAKYKSFFSMEEAEEYLYGSNQMSYKSEGKYPIGCNHSYVDGSFDEKSNRYAYGLVVTIQGVVMHIENGVGENTGERQITGELAGAVKALVLARIKKQSQVVIFHDYFGVGCHATGEWARNSFGAVEYYKKMQNLMKGLEVEFVKVPAHEGDLFNEIVDDVCKDPLGVPTTGAVAKLLVNGERIKAGNQKVYDYLIRLYDYRFIIKAYENNDVDLKLIERMVLGDGEFTR